MKKTVRIVLTFCIASGAAAAPQETKTEAHPTVRPVSGTLHAWRHGKESAEPLKGALEVAPEDRLGTPSGEAASFAADKDALVTLRGVVVKKSKGLGLVRKNGGLVLQLFDGSVLVDSAETTLGVETPFGTVQGKPAVYLVEVTRKEAKVVSLGGRLTFSNSLGSVTLEDGQESAAADNSKPATPKPHGPLRETTADAANLFKNPGFEDDLAGWVDVTTPAAVADSKVAYAGRKSVRFDIQSPAGGKDHWYALFKQNPRIEVGERYLARCFVRVDARRGVKGTFFEVQRGSKEETDTCFRAVQPGKWVLHRVLFTARLNQPEPLVGLSIEGDSIDATVWIDEYFLTRLPK